MSFMTFLPKTKSIALRAVIVLLTILLACAIINGVRMALLGIYVPVVVSLCIWLPLAYGLWNLKNAARVGISILLWWVAIVVPVGMINPFAAINGPGPPFPDVWDLAMLVYPCAAVALVALHVLGKYKKEFA